MISATAKRIFFWGLFLLFFLTAPAALFYAKGYRFSFQQGVFVYTGSITIRSVPQNIEVLLNKKPVKSKKINFINNSYHLDGIKPGEYILDIQSPGHNSWSKKIFIHSGNSYELWNVILTKKEIEKKSYDARGIEKFFISPDNKKIAIAQYGNGGEFLVKILAISSGTAVDVFSSLEYKFAPDKESIEWSPQSDKIIIPAAKDGAKRYFLVNIENNETVNLKDIAGTDAIRNVRWDTEKRGWLYYLSGNTLLNLNPESKELKTLAEDAASYDISGSKIYLFRPSDGIIYRMKSEKINDAEKISSAPPLDMSNPNFQITVYDETGIAFFNKNNKLLYVHNEGDKDDYFKELSGNAEGFQFSDDGKKLLYWSEFEMSLYFLRDWDVQPKREENESRQLLRFSSQIENVQWHKDYEHVLFSTGKKIKIVEADYRDNINIMDILSTNEDNSAFIADSSLNKIFFIGEDGNGKNLYSIDFPEKTGIFGLR